MRVSVIRFPGSNCDKDAVHVWSEVLNAHVSEIWHKDTDLQNPDLVFLPGGFSFGDYLRSGAIARFSPIMAEVAAFQRKGGHIMGVCNGFQILCEMGLLPGALLTNKNLRFICQEQRISVTSCLSPFTANLQMGQVINSPIAHGMGQFYADEKTLDSLEANGQVVFRYCGPNGEPEESFNPNGSARAIAGITDRSGRVLGMMPHPERHAELELGGTSGATFLSGILGLFDRVG